jgi:hypothetical protein
MIVRQSHQNEIAALITLDIEKHPGTKQEQVVKRCIGHYSRSYILTTIDKLIATGHISESREGRCRILFSSHFNK